MFEHFINENEPAIGARRPRTLFQRAPLGHSYAGDTGALTAQ